MVFKLGLIPKFYKEITKNKVIFVKAVGQIYTIVSVKYVSTTTKEIHQKKNKKTFLLDKTDLFNKYGKRIFIKDLDTQKTILLKSSKIDQLTPEELDGFVNKGFIVGFLKMLKGNIYDVTSIVIGALIGVPFGIIIGMMII